jgi:hypothetical protein
MLIMLGAIEHLALISQVVLSFVFGTLPFAILIILVWVGFLTS